MLIDDIKSGRVNLSKDNIPDFIKEIEDKVKVSLEEARTASATEKALYTASLPADSAELKKL